MYREITANHIFFIADGLKQTQGTAVCSAAQDDFFNKVEGFFSKSGGEFSGTFDVSGRNRMNAEFCEKCFVLFFNFMDCVAGI